MIIHNFNDSRFPQSDKDQTIAGHHIPKGYVNATEMINGNGKKLNDYLRLKSSKSYLEVLSLETGIPVSSLVTIGKPIVSIKTRLTHGNGKSSEVALIPAEIFGMWVIKDKPELGMEIIKAGATQFLYKLSGYELTIKQQTQQAISKRTQDLEIVEIPENELNEGTTTLVVVPLIRTRFDNKSGSSEAVLIPAKVFGKWLIKDKPDLADEMLEAGATR